MMLPLFLVDTRVSLCVTPQILATSTSSRGPTHLIATRKQGQELRDYCAAELREECPESEGLSGRD